MGDTMFAARLRNAERNAQPERQRQAIPTEQYQAEGNGLAASQQRANGTRQEHDRRERNDDPLTAELRRAVEQTVRRGERMQPRERISSPSAENEGVALQQERTEREPKFESLAEARARVSAERLRELEERRTLSPEAAAGLVVGAAVTAAGVRMMQGPSEAERQARRDDLDRQITAAKGEINQLEAGIRNDGVTTSREREIASAVESIRARMRQYVADRQAA